MPYQTQNPEEKKIVLDDVAGPLSYLALKGVTTDYELEPSGYVVGLVARTPRTLQLLEEYQNGPTVNVLEFVAAQKRERGKMLTVRRGMRTRRNDGFNWNR